MLELLLGAAIVRTWGQPLVTVIYIVSGLIVAGLLIYARTRDTPDAYRLLSNIGFAAFLFDTFVCLLRAR